MNFLKTIIKFIFYYRALLIPAVGFLVLVYSAIHSFSYTGRDDTDSRVSVERSNMRLLIDYGTGCQYLRSGILSPLIPRMDREGNHVCYNVEEDQF